MEYDSLDISYINNFNKSLLKMRETYTTIIPNIKDENDDIVSIKIVFKKMIAENQQKFVSAEAFDSKGRYFYAKRLEKDYDYYFHKAEEWELDKITYIDFEGSLSIYLEGGGWGDYTGLDEFKDSPFHLQSINNEIAEIKEKLKKLKKKKLQCETFYGNLI